MGAASIAVAITTALAQGTVTWRALLKPPYVYGYSIAGLLLLIAAIAAISASRQESKPRAAEKLAEAKRKQNVVRVTALMRQGSDLYQSLQSAAKNEVVSISKQRSTGLMKRSSS
jgi:hypothetical protein